MISSLLDAILTTSLPPQTDRRDICLPVLVTTNSTKFRGWTPVTLPVHAHGSEAGSERAAFTFVTLIQTYVENSPAKNL